ncbi:hypothetical protein SCUP515_04516 [Seiridium cupressi]
MTTTDQAEGRFHWYLHGAVGRVMKRGDEGDGAVLPGLMLNARLDDVGREDHAQRRRTLAQDAPLFSCFWPIHARDGKSTSVRRAGGWETGDWMQAENSQQPVRSSLGPRRRASANDPTISMQRIQNPSSRISVSNIRDGGTLAMLMRDSDQRPSLRAQGSKPFRRTDLLVSDSYDRVNTVVRRAGQSSCSLSVKRLLWQTLGVSCKAGKYKASMKEYWHPSPEQIQSP